MSVGLSPHLNKLPAIYEESSDLISDEIELEDFSMGKQMGKFSPEIPLFSPDFPRFRSKPENRPKRHHSLVGAA